MAFWMNLSVPLKPMFSTNHFRLYQEHLSSAGILDLSQLVIGAEWSPYGHGQRTAINLGSISSPQTSASRGAADPHIMSSVPRVHTASLIPFWATPERHDQQLFFFPKGSHAWSPTGFSPFSSSCQHMRPLGGSSATNMLLHQYLSSPADVVYAISQMSRCLREKRKKKEKQLALAHLS